MSDEGLPCLNDMELTFLITLALTLFLSLTAVFLLRDTIHGIIQSMKHLMEKGSDNGQDLEILEKDCYQLLCMSWVDDDDYYIRSVNNRSYRISDRLYIALKVEREVFPESN